MRLIKNLCFALLAAVSIVPTTSHALSSRQCNPEVPRTIKYRPSAPQCDGNAAIFLTGRFRRAFSVVFKKVDHNDRLANNCPDASCSPFKAQRQFVTGRTRTICYGAAGTSPVFNGFDPDFGYNPTYVAKWISIKLRNSGKIQDVEIYCLPKPYPKTPLN